MKDLRLLVIDDDDLVLQSIKMALPDQWHMQGFHSLKEAAGYQFDAAIVDMHLTGNTARAEGVDAIAEIRKKHPHLEIVAISGNLDRELMEKCLKAGASRFLAKPLNLDELKLTLSKIEALLLLQGATQRSVTSKHRWIGSSEPSQKVLKAIAALKGEMGPILIEGESGAGKEVTAQLIYEQVADGPFIAVNVAAIPDHLFESEVFGHVKGAFTGADQNKMGLAEAAHGGVLFLDEIEALAPAHQAKLLRFLESGEIRRVGAKEDIQVNTCVIVASNRSLEEMIKKEEFREDLYWRLSAKKIQLPALRERREDIPELCRHFFSQDRVRQKELTEEALEAFAGYNWPGNVRELKRVCEQLLITAPLPAIRRDDVISLLQARGSVSAPTEVDFNQGLPQLVGDYESQIIANCLKQYDDVDEVARILKVSRSNLYKKIKDYGIDWRN